MDSYVWIDSMTGKAMVTEKDGTVREIDLPDEMYEDLLRSKLGRLKDQLEHQQSRDLIKYGWMWPPNAAPATPADPADPLPPLDWGDDEVTEPLFDLAAEREQLRKQEEDWKKNGLCPKCGHRGEWRSLACVCPKHGKFIG